MKQEKEIRLIVRQELQKCAPSATPKFCQLISTIDGYRKAEVLIIDFAIKNQVSISAAIAHLESELG